MMVNSMSRANADAAIIDLRELLKRG